MTTLPRGILTNLALAAGSTLLLAASLLAGEALIGRFRPSPYLRHPSLEYGIRYRFDEGRILLNGRTHSIARPAGKLRILAVGGSTTRGHGAAEGRSWPEALEGELRGRNIDAEVINAGVSGYSCAHLEVFAPELAALLAPDLVMITTGWNWCGIGEPLNWSPFPRLPAGLAWLYPISDSRLFGSLRYRLGRYVAALRPRRYRMQVAEYERARAEHHRRLGPCVERLGRSLEPLAGALLFVIPPSLLALDGPLAGAEFERLRPKLEAFLYCRSESLEDLARCHLAERMSLRVGILEGAAAGTWPVLDGEEFAPAALEGRDPLFLDRMHLSVAGNLELARFLADRIVQGELLRTGGATSSP